MVGVEKVAGEKDGHVHADVGRLEIDVEVEAGWHAQAAWVGHQAALALAVTQAAQLSCHLLFLITHAAHIVRKNPREKTKWREKTEWRGKNKMAGKKIKIGGNKQNGGKC